MSILVVRTSAVGPESWWSASNLTLEGRRLSLSICRVLWGLKVSFHPFAIVGLECSPSLITLTAL